MISKCVVEVEGRFRVSPAGLYKYKVEEILSGKSLTFRVRFGADAVGAKSVQITIQTSLTWDVGLSLTDQERDLFLSVVDSAFVTKGFKCYWVINEGGEATSSSQETTIEDTAGGKWLDEASKRDDISDEDRQILWAEAEKMFLLAAGKN